MAKIEGTAAAFTLGVVSLGTRWPTSARSSPSLGNEPRLFPSLGDLEFFDRLLIAFASSGAPSSAIYWVGVA